MIELGRRGFITGLAALVAAPAIIRVAPLMPISTRFTPAYVPVIWFAEGWRADLKPIGDLKKHSWPRPMGEHWIDLNDCDVDYVQSWARQLEAEFDAQDSMRRQWSSS